MRNLYALISRSVYFPPVVVLIAILIITIWPWQNARQNRDLNFRQSVDETTQSVETNLSERFGVYHTSLRSGAGLLRVDPDLTRDQWNTFFAYKQSTTNRSGIQGTGYVKVFNADEYPEVQASMAAQGIHDFAVHPASLDPDLNSAVLYLYSPTSNGTSALGFNMLSEDSRRQAMLLARDTGKGQLTRKITLVQDVKTKDNKGFLLYVPVYHNGAETNTLEQRRQNIEGFVYGGFRANILFSQILENDSDNRHYSVRVYDSEIKPENILFESSNTKALESLSNTYKTTKPFTMYGVTWQFEYTFNKNQVLSRSENNAPIYIFLVGVVTAFLVFLALLSIFKGRARELQQQKDTEVNLAKDELLSLASHQMRTPATGVKQYLGMVLQGFAGTISKSQEELLDKAYTSNERQLHVINQILHLAKLETGRIVLAKQPTNLNELVRDVVDEQHDDITAHHHQLKLHIPKRIITLPLDSHMVRMAIENLLNNATKYTIKPGTITVKLSQNETHVLISVKDTGIGIGFKDQEEIFKQFTRLHDEQTEKVSGTGVGLYLANQLIKLHKGSIIVNSTPGKGSEFIIRLPKTPKSKQ